MPGPSSPLSRALGFGLAAGLLLAAEPAAAYERSTVDDVPGGIPLYWETRRIEVRLASGTAPVTADEAHEAFLASLRAWSLAGGCTDVVLVDGGEATGLATSLGGGSPDMENRVVFRSADWPAELGPETLALTSAVYRRASGEIVDADIDVNAVDHVWSTTSPAIAGHDDIQNTVTHELGHLLGFAHSAVPDATMAASAAPEELQKRDLAEDDIVAVCDVYPGGARRGPRSSCALVTARRSAAIRGVPLVLGVALALTLRRRRPRRGSSAT